MRNRREVHIKFGKQSDSDNDFFCEKIQPYYGNVLKFLRHLSNDTELAHDLTQEVMMDALKYIHRMRKYDNIEAALIKMAKNKIYRHHLKNPEWLPLDENVIDMSAERIPEEIVLRIESAEEFAGMLDTLDEKYVKLLVLHHCDEIPLKDIAKLYGQKYSTVRSWHARALKKLRELCNKNEEK